MKERAVDAALAREHGLSDEEYGRVLAILGRTPTFTELGIFSVMWSEHCSYKSSRVHLRGMPTSGPRVLQGPGENAGVVDIGDGQAIVFKMESHNHPSFIEPYQGAATGVGGICRDVFTMGARPIALADSLRFGRPDHPRTKLLVAGVVAGIGGYGNAFGVPTVAGDVDFDACYDGNILVNAFCLGLARADRIFKGNAGGIGNPVLYVGAKTGRDGIHGATMASAEFGEGTEAKRPTVQVGDPFMEKLLLEACLELMASDCLVGIQDMGAAGLTSSSVEMASRAGNGIELWLDKVPVRETHMTPYELMLSESQERMLCVVKKGRETEALAIFDKWDLDAAVIGVVTDTGRATIKMGGEIHADVPVTPLTEGLTYRRPMRRPRYLDDAQGFEPSQLPPPKDWAQAVLRVVGSPGIASKEWVYRQYDHNVRHGTVLRPGMAGAGVVRVLTPDGTREKGVAVTSGCRNRFVFLDPYEGARLTVAEAAQNLVAAGAEPLAVTDCLNFGNPEKPEIMWQFAEAVRGMGDACRELDTPIVSGNVSFYNETDGRAIHPTPMIAMVGLLPDARHRVGQAFRRPGLAVALVGETTGELGGSAYLKIIHGETRGRPPRYDGAKIRAANALVLALARAQLLQSATDVSDGGLVTSLVEGCVSGPEPLGFVGQVAAPKLYPQDILFGEEPGRFVVSFFHEQAAHVMDVVKKHAGVPFQVIGTTGGEAFTLRLGPRRLELDVPISELAQAWRDGFRRIEE
ncbi:MAG TPA: phosphoribosylformylglycinamidine synthase subunit PurL [Haliangiales bacterium]|nr:phosphoribosylformylglycinamidine synthase subunit PurL [Haliangiales bacterium]